jgi:hypothetical protein
MLTSDKIDYKSSDSEINDPMLLSTKIETLVTESERKDAEIRTLMNERFELLTTQFDSRFAAQATENVQLTAQFNSRFAAQATENDHLTAQFNSRFASQATENDHLTAQFNSRFAAQAKENVRLTEQVTEQLLALQGTVLYDWIKNVATKYVTSSSHWEIVHFKRIFYMDF